MGSMVARTTTTDPPSAFKTTPSNHKASVRRSYARHVETFEKWTPSTAFRETFHRAVLDEITRRLSATSALRMLEVGCGHGTWAEEICQTIADAGRKIEYVGIDFTEARIEAARRRMASNRAASFLCMDCECYEPDRPFDLILAVEVVSHVPFDRYPDWFARWQGWLCDLGSLVIIDKDRYSQHNLRLKWDSFKRRFLPGFLSGRRYYFAEDFADLVSTLNYPSFGRMSRIARSAGLMPRPIIEHGMFRALIADRPA